MIACLFLWACSGQKDVVFDFEQTVSAGNNENNEPSTTQNEDTFTEVSEPSEPSVSEPTEPSEEPQNTEICNASSTGVDIGECASNFALMNENDNMVELYAYQGDVIFLDLSSFT